MKKFIAVSMIALLAVSTVFAAASVTGSAELTGKLDFTKDNIGAGFDANVKDTKATFTFEGATADKAGEGKVYAEIGAAVTVKTVEAKAADAAIGLAVDSLKLTKANIVGDNWSVSILGPKGVDTFAGDWYAYDDDGNTHDAALSVGAKGAGVTAKIADYAIGLGGYVGQTRKEGTLTLTTPEYTLAEGLALQAAAGASFAESKLASGAGFAFGFASDAVSVDAAVDFADVYNTSAKENDFTLDAALSVAVAPVTLNAYYATKNDADVENWYTVGADVALKDLTGLDITLSLGAINIKKASGSVLASVAYAGAFNASADVEVATTDDLAWSLDLGADYTFENIGKLAGSLSFGGDKAEALQTVGASVSFSNDTLINGATLSAKYASKNFLAEDGTAAGAITTSVKISL